MTSFRLLLLSLAIFCLSLLQLSSQIKVYSKRNAGWGLNLLKDFDKLHHLRTGMISFTESSQDKNGGNFDGCCGSYLYKDGGEYVIAEMAGPGVITRIWVTNYSVYDSVNRIRIYLDGDEKPDVDENIRDFFGGSLDYLPFPLCANEIYSSGGHYCYFNFPFSESAKVTITKDDYYQVAYYKVNPWIPIPDFQKKHDYDEIISLWSSQGEDPKDVEYEFFENTVDAPAKQITETAFLNNGKKTIGRLFLNIPKLKFRSRVIDDGISFGWASSFKMKINPLHEQVVLRRRLDYGISGQKAEVFVDGKKTGVWFTPGIDTIDRWLDAEYAVPYEYTKGKDELKIRVKLLSSSRDWNEFRYWIFSDEELTDSLDVGNKVSEKEHDYKVEFKIWEGRRNFQYPGLDSASLHIIDSVFLQIYWDDMEYPAVNAPIAMAFGGGLSDVLKFQSFPAGVTPDDRFYSYYPMPYNRRARVLIDNRSSYDLEEINIKIGFFRDTVPMENLGYFHAVYNENIPTVPKVDHNLFTAEGTGHYVGVTLECRDTWGGYLEGDERFYTEGAGTPFCSGTGTEDYFNCGFHYRFGNLTLPFHGYTIGILDTRTQYRWHIPDPVPFYSKAVFGFEHGPANFITPIYYSTAFFYLNPQRTAVVCDSLDIGASDEHSHSYGVKVSSPAKELESSYTGEKSHILLKKKGRYHNSESSFNMKILPENSGVFLMRTLDYGNLNQESDVYVDGEFAGKWLNAGSNTFSRWRDDIFIISPALTYGKSDINIKIDARKSPSPWSEFFYKTMCLTDADTMTIDTSTADTSEDTNSFVRESIFEIQPELRPNPAGSELFLEFHLEKPLRGELIICRSSGEARSLLEKRLFNKGVNTIKIDTRQFPPGVYFIYLKKKQKIIFSEKAVITGK